MKIFIGVNFSDVKRMCMQCLALLNKIMVSTFLFWVVFFTLDMASTWYFLSFLPVVSEQNPVIRFFVGSFGIIPGLIIFEAICLSILTAINYVFYHKPCWPLKIIAISLNIGFLCKNLLAFVNNMQIIYQLTSLP